MHPTTHRNHRTTPATAFELRSLNCNTGCPIIDVTPWDNFYFIRIQSVWGGFHPGLQPGPPWGSDSHVTSRPPRLWPIRGCIEGIFTGYKARGIQVSRWQGRRVCSLAAELAVWLDAKWPRGELLKCHAYLILPLVSGWLLPIWANSHLKRWVSAGPVGLAEWQKASWSGLW